MDSSLSVERSSKKPENATSKSPEAKKKVLLISLDAFPNHKVSPELTPTLWSLANDGGRCLEGGVSILSSATYPNHATFVTGQDALGHKIMANRVYHNGQWVNAADFGPQCETIFQALKAIGVTTSAVVGDQNLVGVCALRDADKHWPLNGELSDDIEKSPAGYIADAAVLKGAKEIAAHQADFCFAQIDQVDGARHWYGAESQEAAEQCKQTDAALAEFLKAWQPEWSNTIVFIVSDHDQETVSDSDPINIAQQLANSDEEQAVFEQRVYYQGTAALVVGEGLADRLAEIEGVTEVHQIDSNHSVVSGAYGQTFGSMPNRLKGEHGGIHSRTQLAIVAGGHQLVAEYSKRLNMQRPSATVWAHWVAEIFGTSLPTERAQL